MRCNISPRFTKVEIETKTKIDKTVISLETDHTVEIQINHIEAEEITIETIDQIIGVDHETTIDMMIDETIIDKIIEGIITETIIGQIMEETIIEKRDIELEVKVGRILEIIIGIMQEKDLIKVEIEAEIGEEKDKCN